jgi:hypothetical protein
VTTFALVASPLVGPAGWRWLAGTLQDRGHAVAVPALADVDSTPAWLAHVERVVAQLSHETGAVLVGHSAAGRLIPLVAERLDARACVFVDAQLPVDVLPSRDDDRFLAFVRTLACDGRLPPWSEWWGVDAWASLVPDAGRRELLAAVLPRVPLAAVEELPPAPSEPVRGAYLQLSAVYRGEAAAAGALGWPVARLDAQHLHFVVDERAVADALEQLVGQLA